VDECRTQEKARVDIWAWLRKDGVWGSKFESSGQVKRC